MWKVDDLRVPSLSNITSPKSRRASNPSGAHQQALLVEAHFTEDSGPARTTSAELKQATTQCLSSPVIGVSGRNSRSGLFALVTVRLVAAAEQLRAPV
jgi:hypothetical protein